MPRYRLIGYYDDNGQVYDGNWSGDDACDAVAACRGSMPHTESRSLVLVAILDEAGANVYEPDTASHVTDWPTEDDT